MKRQLLIVDDYNMIGSQLGLAQFKKQDKVADTREAPLYRLLNYARYEGMEAVVVFDVQLVPGIQQNHKKYQLDVVFTKEDGTTDSHIERIAGQLNDRLIQVTVATSDLAERRMIFPQGILRTSAHELHKTIKKTEKTIAQENKDIHFIDFRRNSPWSEEQLKKLSRKLDDLMRGNK